MMHHILGATDDHEIVALHLPSLYHDLRTMTLSTPVAVISNQTICRRPWLNKTSLLD